MCRRRKCNLEKTSLTTQIRGCVLVPRTQKAFVTSNAIYFVKSSQNVCESLSQDLCTTLRTEVRKHLKKRSLYSEFCLTQKREQNNDKKITIRRKKFDAEPAQVIETTRGHHNNLHKLFSDSKTFILLASFCLTYESLLLGVGPFRFRVATFTERQRNEA